MTTTQVKWLDGMTFIGIDSNNKAAVMSDGAGPGVSPMQMLLLGLGGCTMADVVSILQKQRQPLESFEIVVEGERSEEYPMPWTKMHLHYIFTGAGLDPNKVERAIDLSIEKYCGVHATLSGVAKISHDFEIRQA
jgi:putative redox protein